MSIFCFLCIGGGDRGKGKKSNPTSSGGNTWEVTIVFCFFLWLIRLCFKCFSFEMSPKKCCLNRPHHNGSLESRWWFQIFIARMMQSDKWFQFFFYGHPLFGGNDPNFDYYFSNGWFNHQLEVVSCLWLRCTNVKLRWPQATNNQLMINTLVNLKKKLEGQWG